MHREHFPQPEPVLQRTTLDLSNFIRQSTQGNEFLSSFSCCEGLGTEGSSEVIEKTPSSRYNSLKVMYDS